MRRILRSPGAEADLIEIWKASLRNWGIAQADKYSDEITEAIEALGTYPHRGPECGWIRAGYRRLTVRHHCVFYYLDDDAVRIVRVLHERMDWENRLRN